jgi:hypothetical protein
VLVQLYHVRECEEDPGDLLFLFSLRIVAVFGFTNFVIEANSRYAGVFCAFAAASSVQTVVHQRDCKSALQILNASIPVYTVFYASLLVSRWNVSLGFHVRCFCDQHSGPLMLYNIH